MTQPGGVPAWLDEARATRAFYAVVALGVCAGALAVLRDLLQDGAFWVDELYYLAQLRLPLAEAMSRHIRVDVHPPLYFFLLGAWTQVFGTSEVAVRSLSVLGALGALAVLWWRGGGQASPVALSFASLWLATHWVWVIYAREARMYTLAMLGGCWLALSFARLWNAGREPASRELWAFCLGTLLLAFLHYSAMALACSALLLLLYRCRRSPGLWPPLVAVGALCLAWTVWHIPHITGGGWLPGTVQARLSGPLAAAATLWSLLFPGSFLYLHSTALSLPLLWVWPVFLCVYGPMAVAWVRRGRPRDGRAAEPDRTLLRGLLPLLGVFLAVLSLAHQFTPILMQKSLAVALPSLALCIGCVGAILWRTRMWVLCALALALAGASLPAAVHGLHERWFLGFPFNREGFRETALLLAEQPADTRVYCSLCRPHFLQALGDSIGLEERQLRKFGQVAWVREGDVRHLLPPLFAISLRHGLPPELRRLRGRWGSALQDLGPWDDGQPARVSGAFHAYYLPSGGGAELQ